MGKVYSQMTFAKRIKLETMFSLKMSKVEIARNMGISLKTVYNEWNRGKYTHLKSDLTKETRYSAEKAQQIRDYNVTARGTIPKLMKDRKLAKCLEEKIVEGLSPKAAVEVMKKNGEMKKFTTTVCTKTVYNSISAGYFQKITNKELPVKRNKKKSKKKVIRQKRACPGKSIEERPDFIAERNDFGHMEMDSVIGKREKGNTLLTIVERKTRQIIIRKQPDKTAASVVKTLDQLEKEMGDNFYKIFKTITVDNGTEFADVEGIERSCLYPGKKRTTVYYCHPYSSYERGSNENNNRMVRRKVPKGTNFDKMTAKEVQEIEDWINNYPRRMFNFRSSNELYKEEMKYLI